jgi:riboflavin synthase
MFTGIIEEVGKVEARYYSGALLILTIKANLSASLFEGVSVAINGVCVTVVGKGRDTFQVEVSRETQHLTTLSHLKRGERVNLEKPLTASSLLSGHIVTGHIEGKGSVLAIEDEQWWFSFPPSLKKYIVPKGSIACDGVSLTVVECFQNKFSVVLLPYTLQQTTFGVKKVGEEVNLEPDILAKYAERILQEKQREDKSALKLETLVKSGFVK